MSKCSSVALYILSWLRARPVLMTAALLLAGALSVHELRYLVAFGDEAEDALAHHGHGFLTFLTPLLVTLAAIGMAAHWFARGHRAGQAPSTAGSALLPLGHATAALLIIYTGQELLEGRAGARAPSGLGGSLRRAISHRDRSIDP